MHVKPLSLFASERSILLWPIGLLIVGAVLVAVLAAGGWAHSTVRSAPASQRSVR